MTVCSRMDGITENLLQSFIAGEVKCVGWPRPYSCGIKASDWPPYTLRFHDAPESIHHITVAGIRFWLKALHAGLQQGNKCVN